MKTCRLCHVQKELSCFSKQPRNRDGLFHECKVCSWNRVKERMAANPELKVRQKEAVIRARNKRMAIDPVAEKERTREQGRKYYTSGKLMQWRLLTRYGLTIEQFHALKKSQNNVCKICKLPETRVRRDKLMELVVDHDHKTGKVRGLLCHKCNTAIGLLDDNLERLRAAARYMETG